MKKIRPINTENEGGDKIGAKGVSRKTCSDNDSPILKHQQEAIDDENEKLDEVFIAAGCSSDEVYLIAVEEEESHLRLKLLGSEIDKWLTKVHEKFFLNEIFVLFWVTAMILFLYACCNFTKENNLNWVFFLLSFFGLFCPINMLGSRVSRLLRMLFSNFDFLFAIYNVTSWAIMQSVTLQWDERSFCLFAIEWFIMCLILTSEATFSDFEYDNRAIFYVVGIVIQCATLICNAGGLFKDQLESTLTFAPFSESRNTTIGTNRSNGTNTSSTALVSRNIFELTYNIGQLADTRFCTYILWICRSLAKAIFYPSQCPLSSRGLEKRIVHEQGLTKTKCSQRKLTLSVTDSSHAELKVEAETKALLERVVDDRKMITFYPEQGFTFKAGISHSLLFVILRFFCFKVKTIEKIHNFLHLNCYRTLGNTMVIVSLLIAVVSQTKIIDEKFAWLSLLCLFNVIKNTLNKNIYLLRMLLQTFTFWYVLGTLTLALWASAHSFNYEPAHVCFVSMVWAVLIVAVLLQDATQEMDKDEKKISIANPAAFIFCTILFTTWLTLINLNLYPNAVNVIFNFRFLKNDITVGSITIINRAVAYGPLLYIIKLCRLKILHPDDFLILKSSVERKIMTKAEIEQFVRIYNQPIKVKDHIPDSNFFVSSS